MKGIIQKVGKTALNTAVRRAANAANAQAKGGRMEVKGSENGGIRLGNTQSINGLGNRNGFGVFGLPDRPLTPMEIGGDGFNPFNIPPGIAIEGIELTKCHTIITFQNYLGGFKYGTWSIGYRDPNCPIDENPELPEPTESSPMGPRGNYSKFISCGDKINLIVFYGYEFIVGPDINWEAANSDNWRNRWLRRPGNSIDFPIKAFPFWKRAYKLPTVAAAGNEKVSARVYLYEGLAGFLFYISFYELTYKNKGIRRSRELHQDLDNLFPDLEPEEGWTILLSGGEIRRGWGIAWGDDDCSNSIRDNPIPRGKRDKMNEDCCEEILDALEAQDEKISRLLDLLDPEGAWPITIPGQMIQLDNEKAKPLELKSYPELWTAQLATQNRLREVAAPPGAWPIAFPKGIIEPMGEGELKIQSIGAMLTAILRGLDAKLGPIVNEVELQDGTPLEPGNQKVSLRFFGLSSIACQILQIAIDNEGDIDLSNNMLLRLAMTAAATQKAATQSALQTSEILDALGAKMNDKVEEVPFFFNPQAAAEVAENLQNTEESTESLMAAILDTSTQKIKYLSVDEKRNIIMRLTQMEQAINTIQAGQAVEWDGSKFGLAALMSSYMLIDQIQDYKLRKELRNLDNQGDFGEWSKQHEAGYPEATATDEYSDPSKPWGRNQSNQPKIRKVDNNPDREQ